MTLFFCLCVGWAGVSKVVTVDVRGSWQRWLKVRDLTKGVTYTFSVQALTVSYGPPIQANLTAQPVQGTHGCLLNVVIMSLQSSYWVILLSSYLMRAEEM